MQTALDAILQLRASTPKEIKRFIKFLIVGAMGFVVDFGSFNVFHIAGIGRWVAASLVPPGAQQLAAYLLARPEVVEQALSFAAAVTSNFVWNHFWIYPEAKASNPARKVIQFVVVSVLGLVIGIPIFAAALSAAERAVAALSLDGLPFNLAGNIALVCRVLVLLFWNFFVNRYWTFGEVK